MSGVHVTNFSCWLGKVVVRATMAASEAPIIPDKIGSLLFCTACGSLLDLPSNDDVITCAPCGTVQDARSTYPDAHTSL